MDENQVFRVRYGRGFARVLHARMMHVMRLELFAVSLEAEGVVDEVAGIFTGFEKAFFVGLVAETYEILSVVESKPEPVLFLFFAS